MTTITTKTLKTIALTHGEMDDNFSRDVQQKTTNYTVDIADNRSIIECETNAFNVTMPAAATILSTEYAADFMVTIKNIQAGSNEITILPTGADTIDDATGYILTALQSVTLELNSTTDGWNVINNYSASQNNRNYCINGAFKISQRGNVTGKTGMTAAYAGDRYQVGFRTNGTFSIGTSAFNGTQPYGSNTGYVNATTVPSSVGVADYVVLGYTIEGVDAVGFKYGQSDAKPFTLSFSHKHTRAGTYYLNVRNSALNRHYVTTYTQSVGDTWERSFVTIPGDTSGTWLYTEGVIGIKVNFVFQAGTDFDDATLETWGAGNELWVTGSPGVNPFQVNGDAVRLAAIKLEAASHVSSFTTAGNSIAEEWILCERYLESSYDQDVAIGTADVKGAKTERMAATLTTGGVVDSVQFRTKKAKAAFCNTYASNAGGSGTGGFVWNNGSGGEQAINTTAIGTSGFQVTTDTPDATHGLYDGQLAVYHWFADAEL